MRQRCSLAEIRERTYKRIDAWWTVLLVDPLASRLVWLAAPYRRITPNLLTGLATAFGLAAAACFARADRGWLLAGALLFHLGFVVDCMDGKIARLNGTGSLFGAWFDFIFDRVRAIVCAVALMGGQYARTGDTAYLWLATAVVSLDLLRYVNSAQMTRIRTTMREESGELIGPVPPPGPERPAKALLHRWRIRTHLVSGIEFEMAVFVVGPLTGAVFVAPIVAGALLVLFEFRLIYYLWRSTRRHAAEAAARHPAPPAAVPQAHGPAAARPHAAAGGAGQPRSPSASTSIASTRSG
jgi:phosphatidylglycerophosphate synthase